MLNYAADLPDISTSNLTAVTTFNGVAYICTSEPRMRSYDLTSFAPGVSSTTNPASSPSGIAIITLATSVSSAGTAVIVSSSNTQYDFVNLSTGTRTQTTTNAVATRYSSNNQQVASIPSLGLAIATQAASGGVRLINGNSQTASLLTITGMTNEVPTSVIARTPSSTFLVGSSLGIVREITTAGVVINSVAIPQSPSVGTQLQAITGLANYGKYVVAVSDHGMMYCINWDNGQITDALICGQSTNSMSLSNSVSGTVILPAAQSPPTAGGTLTEVWFETGKFVIQDIFVEENTQLTFAAAIDPVANKVVRLATSTILKARVFNISPMNKTLVDTRIQFPLGTDIPGRIIRLRDTGIGSAWVELDTTIGASLSSLQATEDKNYIEIALTSNPQPVGWDIREFKS